MIIHYLSQITWIINSSLASGIFPCIWKKAEVLPIPKGDHRMSNNNRPISLVTILSKVCERVAFNQLVTNLVANSQLATRQNGNSNGEKNYPCSIFQGPWGYTGSKPHLLTPILWNVFYVQRCLDLPCQTC